MLPSPRTFLLRHPHHHLLRSPHQQTRHASLLRRPKRPYTFTQLITLSDGSTFLHRTTSPQPIYRSTKDTKNAALWNPSSQRLRNVEEDEAGRLRRFRRRFGRGFDVEAVSEDGDGNGEAEVEGEGGEGDGMEALEAASDKANQQRGPNSQKQRQRQESLLDLISGYGQEAEKKGEAAGVREEKMRSGKGKGGEK